jgi:hypothetical protein
MNTHPDILWELVRAHEQQLRAEAEDQNRSRAASGTVDRLRAALTAWRAGRSAGDHQVNDRPKLSHRASTLAACAPGGAD